jgi:hypothetical protein
MKQKIEDVFVERPELTAMTEETKGVPPGIPPRPCCLGPDLLDRDRTP